MVVKVKGVTRTIIIRPSVCPYQVSLFSDKDVNLITYGLYTRSHSEILCCTDDEWNESNRKINYETFQRTFNQCQIAKNEPKTSNVAKHVFPFNHDVETSNLKLIHKVNNFYELGEHTHRDRLEDSLLLLVLQISIN